LYQKNEFLTGTITPFPTVHGYGLIGKCMGPGASYLIELPGEPTVYISGDTVFNQTVRNVLTNSHPDISILNAGTAALDLGRPILMPLDELINFIRTASGKVIAVHLDAFNHCLTNRDILRETVLKEGLSDKVIIPTDGELLDFSQDATLHP
jgi:L-ascorbate metabolism protein UlaG (beta-lactamase superfamily)